MLACGHNKPNLLTLLQISLLCNETSHDKVAPTKQNLICEGKSAMEVIKMQKPAARGRPITLQPPRVTFVQEKRNKEGLIIILDNGPQMTQEKWSIFRQGK